MPIHLIIFDLDGVLVDSRELHYEALNAALSEVDPKFIIGRDEHLGRFDGLPTSTKLNMLTKERQLPIELHGPVWRRKQSLTQEYMKKTICIDVRLQKLLEKLKSEGYMLYCASNSIWTTIRDMLLAKGIAGYMDYWVSNEDVKRPKPHPDVYLHCIARAGVSVSETLICEDSHLGRQSALSSGAHLCPIINPSDLTEEKVRLYLTRIAAMTTSMDLRWKGKLRVVIPMAGHGSRFVRAGYDRPKPLIDVMGKPMIQRVIENLNVDAEFIYIVQKSHVETFALTERLQELTPGCHVISIDGVTEGAACSVLLAQHLINDDVPLLIANCDQIVEWNSNEFLHAAQNVDGSVLTFHHPERDNKWSFAATDPSGFITEIREKVPISDEATVGIYYWKRGQDFVKYAQQMIDANERVNNEFYTAPVYNYGIRDGLKFKVHRCRQMWGIGTPQDLEYYLSKHV